MFVVYVTELDMPEIFKKPTRQFFQRGKTDQGSRAKIIIIYRHKRHQSDLKLQNGNATTLAGNVDNEFMIIQERQ